MDIPVDLQWRESSCARDLTALNFADSVQDYNIEIQSPEVFIPSKTYMRFVVEVSGAPGAHTGTAVVQPTVEQQIALAEGCIANCFTSAYFKAGNWDISYVSDNFPQASAVEMRTSSGVWNDRLGAYTQGYIGDRSSRVAAISKTTTGVAGNNALIGVNLNEGKEEIYRPTDGQTPDLATLEGKVNEAGITMAGGASIAAADVGSTLVVNRRRYVINAITGGQVNVGVSFADAAVGPPQLPRDGISFVVTRDWPHRPETLFKSSGALQL